MRPNGAAHLANDTFLSIASDAVEHVHLCTSSFEVDNRVSEAPLNRKARFRCDTISSLPPSKASDAVGSERLAALLPDSARHYRHSLHPSPDGTHIAVISHYFEDGEAEEDTEVGAESTVEGASSRSTSVSFSSSSSEADKEEKLKRPLRHFLLIMSQVPVRVWEWQCPSECGEVRGVCWYPGSTAGFTAPVASTAEALDKTPLPSGMAPPDSRGPSRRLVLLMESGHLLSYDTSVAQLDVALLRPRRLHCQHFLDGFLMRQGASIREATTSRVLAQKNPSASAPIGAAFPTPHGVQFDAAAAPSVTFTPPAADIFQRPQYPTSTPFGTTPKVPASATFLAGGKLSSNIKSVPALPRHFSTIPPAAATPLNNFGLPGGMPTPVTESVPLSAGSGGAGVGTFVSAFSTLQRPAGAPQSHLPLSSTIPKPPVQMGNRQGTLAAPFLPTNAIPRPVNPQRAAAPFSPEAAVEATIRLTRALRQSCPTSSKSSACETHTSDMGSTEEDYKGHPYIDRMFASRQEAERLLAQQDDSLGASVHNRDQHIVDFTFIPPTRSLPPIILLLTRSGDVYSVKANEWGLPEQRQECSSTDDGVGSGSEAHSAGWSPLRSALYADANAMPSSTASPDAADAPIVFRHLIHGRGSAEAESSLPLLSNEFASQPLAPLAVRGVLLDEDTGLHAILILFNTGCLVGALVEEPQLLARHRVPPEAKCSLHRTSMQWNALEPLWKVQLGPYVACSQPGPKESRQYSSPMRARRVGTKAAFPPLLPPTFAIVHWSVVNNISLIRYLDDAAYLVALPTWNVRRKGWCYWKPYNSSASLARMTNSSLRKEKEMEEMRWSLVGTDPSSVPEPLALRVPFDVKGLSVALGEREVVLAPTWVTVAAPHPILSLDLSGLLRGAVLAMSKGLHLTFGERSVIGHNSTSREASERLSLPSGEVRSPRMDPEAAASTGSGMTQQQEAVDAELEALLNLLSSAYAAFFASSKKDTAVAHKKKKGGKAHATPPLGPQGGEKDVLPHIKDIAELMDGVLNKIDADEQQLSCREALLKKRLGKVQKDLGFAEEVATSWAETLTDAIVRQRGEAAFRTANERLGAMHTMLLSYEEQLMAMENLAN
eukprot:gene3854-2732_t